jgi:hypothetical protein
VAEEASLASAASSSPLSLKRQTKLFAGDNFVRAEDLSSAPTVIPGLLVALNQNRLSQHNLPRFSYIYPHHPDFFGFFSGPVILLL